jgi:uncharacterized protein YoaH (UPF0181 family)
MFGIQSRFVSPEAFVKQYRLYGVSLDPHQQQDAVEILQDFLSRFESTAEVPALFSETLRHTIHSNTLELSFIENFIILALEVFGYPSPQE